MLMLLGHHGKVILNPSYVKATDTTHVQIKIYQLVSSGQVCQSDSVYLGRFRMSLRGTAISVKYFHFEARAVVN